jgi:acyl-[acyl-carrier-protein]-phospholipid O-acyltransferase/long-chain-fatty-acid--[acyl-carrier-protein] ligase
MMPGMEWRIDPVPASTAAGCILRGPNVMDGYLSPDDPEVIDPLEGGWHDTGDIVEHRRRRLCTILGRMKRFAKIGGEMCQPDRRRRPGQRRSGRRTHHAVVSVPGFPQGREAGSW